MKLQTRYQVMADKHKNGKLYNEIHDFAKKSEANKKAKELKANGVKGVVIWDCYNNPLSNLIRFGG